MIRDLILFVFVLLTIAICELLIVDAIIKQEMSIRQEIYEKYNFPSKSKYVVTDGKYKTIDLEGSINE